MYPDADYFFRAEVLPVVASPFDSSGEQRPGQRSRWAPPGPRVQRAQGLGSQGAEAPGTLLLTPPAWSYPLSPRDPFQGQAHTETADPAFGTPFWGPSQNNAPSNTLASKAVRLRLFSSEKPSNDLLTKSPPRRGRSLPQQHLLSSSIF